MGCCNSTKPKKVVEVPKIPSNIPRLHNDGSIEFPEGVSVLEIDGYAPCEDNPRVLKPSSPGCAYRITGIMLNKNGTYTPHHVCRHQKCEHRSKSVTFKICEGCPFRST